ncbi:DBH-like monooxygenase protein 1 homolog [Gigantopelta aegis]|uniref:DBH-like monooxygenase protein 1 homolog n=1 Tax=Gigantopelta aegis TaxID=1735272 RepID=UPI001B8875CE|nr:DBH-like monooxygenase protein 1 homolog [Gigantopelta aegis]
MYFDSSLRLHYLRQSVVGKNVHPPPTPSETFPVYAQLDSKGEYFLFWKFNKTHITFETHVKTLGYVGFGISHNGDMYPADVVIGWVDNGKVHFKDRHTLGHYEPIIDDSQDWTLLAGFERGEHTVLKFVRALDTCDDKQDIKITDGTVRVIYSYHPDDPQHETGLTYHGGASRGSKSLMLLDEVPQGKQTPPDTKHFDFINKKFVIPAQKTFYHCTAYRLPSLARKHHMFKWEAILQPGNEDLVHHILVYTCPGHIDPSRDGASYECYEHPPHDLRRCNRVFIAWAVGGDAFTLPDHVGISIGTPEDAQFVVLETHYNNPGRRQNVVDSSGLRMFYTPTLRQYDAGILETGVMVHELQMIPPEFDNFVSKGICNQQCVSRMTGAHSGGVKVIAAFLHAHLLGMGVTTRHFRNGTELAPIMKDEHYDFDFQEYRLLKEERLITKDDVLQTECYYKSRGLNRFTYGGLSTSDEMCLSFLMYYPKVPVFACLSVPIYSEYRSTQDRSDSALRRYLQTLDWTNSTVRNEFQKHTDDSLYYLECRENHIHHKGTTENPPKILHPYTEPVNSACSNH